MKIIVLIIENLIKVIYDVIEDVSDGEIGPPKLKIMVMYIDFGGNQMLKKGEILWTGGLPLQFGQCPKERALACPPSLRLQRWKFWNGKYLKSPQPELLRLSF